MKDKGPFFVYPCPATNTTIGVISEDFKHDVLLRVDGDFESEKQKKEYCEDLAEKLNSKFSFRRIYE